MVIFIYYGQDILLNRTSIKKQPVTQDSNDWSKVCAVTQDSYNNHWPMAIFQVYMVCLVVHKVSKASLEIARVVFLQAKMS